MTANYHGIQHIVFGHPAQKSASCAKNLTGDPRICSTDRIVATGGTCMRLTGTRSSLIPVGGGIKEFVGGLYLPPCVPAPRCCPIARRFFEFIALAKVPGSVLEAWEMGFLGGDDRAVMNLDRPLSAARREVLDLADGYAPPAREKSGCVSGPAVRAALKIGDRDNAGGAGTGLSMAAS